MWRISRGRWLGVAVVWSALLVPQSGWAGCGKADAAGTWDLFALWSGGPNDNGWTYCALVVGGAGKVKRGEKCRIDKAESSEQGARLRGGKISVKGSCQVTGKFQIGGCAYKIDEAWMTKDKLSVGGVGEDCRGAVFKFDAVKVE